MPTPVSRRSSTQPPASNSHPHLALVLLASFFGALTFFLAQRRAPSVGPGDYTNDFSAQPPATDWATSSRAGAASDNYDSDTDVAANISAGAVTSPTTLDTNNPPPKIATATWSSTGLYL